MGEAHDDWLQGLGIDIDKLRQGLGGGAPGFKPVTDPSLQAAVVDTVSDFTQNFAKGASNTASGIANSPAGRIANPTAPLANLSQQGLDALVSGDPSKIDLGKAFSPNVGIDLNNPVASLEQTANDPAQQQKAMAQAQGIVRSVVDPIGFQKDAAVATGDVLLHGDPGQVGEAAGSTAVIAGAALVGAAELGAAGEVGAAGEGAAAGRAPAIAPEGPIVLGDAPPVNPGAAVPESAGANAAAGDLQSPGAVSLKPVAAPEVPGPIGAADPPPAFDPPGLGPDEPFGRETGEEHLPVAPGETPDLPPDLPPVSEPGSGPVTPRVPSSEDVPQPLSDPPGSPDPRFIRAPDLPPPSRLPGIDEPTSPPSLPPGKGPGFPFGVDEPQPAPISKLDSGLPPPPAEISPPIAVSPEAESVAPPPPPSPEPAPAPVVADDE